MNRLLQGALLLVGLGVSGVALAGQPVGRWNGLVQQANSDVRAQLAFSTDKVDVHFDEPLACNVPAKFLKDADIGATVYRFGVSANGGRFCQDLQGRNATFKPGEDGHLVMDFPSARTTWRGEFKPLPTAAATP